MKLSPVIFAVAVLATSPPAAAEPPGTYLVSLRNVGLGPGDRVEQFKIDTWAIQILAVCSIPPGWRIRAGGSATLEGVIEGEGTHGTTWMEGRQFSALRNLALVRIEFPVVGGTTRHGPGTQIATFLGDAFVQNAEGRWRHVPLTLQNIGLAPARGCPGV